MVRDVYKTLHENRDYGFRDQIQRSALSVMNNIAEGFERKGDKELLRFFIISLGSLGELRSMLYTAEDLHYLSHEVADKMRCECWEIRGLIIRFMDYLRRPNSSDVRPSSFPSPPRTIGRSGLSDA